MKNCSCGAPLPHKKVVGAVVVFKEGITKEQVERALALIGRGIESQEIQEFHPEHGTPVFYIP
jgi:hypothetical protein